MTPMLLDDDPEGEEQAGFIGPSGEEVWVL